DNPFPTPSHAGLPQTFMNFCLHSSARTVQETVARAQRAEALGFEPLFLADSQMNNVDPYQALALCAVNTKIIRLGTAVTNMVYRDPTITANSFATLNEISQGRAIIGMGTGDGPVYSLGRTATKLADFEKGLRVMRDLLHDRGIDVPVSHECAGGNVRLRAGHGPAPLSIYVEGPKALRIVGRVCDGGIFGTRSDQQVTDWARRQIAAGAQEVGRSSEEIDLMPAGMIAVHEDGNIARQSVRASMANRAHPNFTLTIVNV